MTFTDGLEYSTPTLMRAARGAYAQAMRAELEQIDADDLPKNGAVLLAGIGGPRQSGSDLPQWLGVSRQAVSQAVDVLVERGYVERDRAEGDRRRLELRLTDRGRQVLEASARGVETVDMALTERTSADQVLAMRTCLAALGEIKLSHQQSGIGVRPRTSSQARSFSPIFPVRGVPAALEHYARLGFAATAYEDGHEYGFAERDDVSLHLVNDPDHDPGHGSGMAYLYVRDADALYAEWEAADAGGLLRPVGPTPYRLREGSYVDPDGNLIRFGSPDPAAE